MKEVKLFVLCLAIALFSNLTAYSQLSDTSRVSVQIGQLRQCLLVNDSLQLVKQENAILSHSKELLQQEHTNTLKREKKATRRLKWANRYAILSTITIVLLFL